ncbi:MAG: M14 family metallopeptidase [Wenzhouxiangellaceae bacterium]|nr:M14 family metallopeptidase [Wenzhouxiangellaceae bacterium]
MRVAMLDHLPSRLLEHPATRLARHLDGPTLIHLPGRRPDPLFVSVLQHGNEISGWDAVRRLLAGRYQRDPLPRSLVLFIGNIAAAAERRRHLDDQPDMNRCWPGAAGKPTAWHTMLAEVTEHVRSLKPFASIDIHNNTGENPHYAAVNAIEPARLNLASRFSRTAVYFTEPRGVQSMAFGAFCPSVTLECGPPGKRGGTDHAMAYLEQVLNLDRHDLSAPHPEDLDLFQVTTVVHVPRDQDFVFGHGEAGLRLDARIDRLNFQEIPPGTRLARTDLDSVPLKAFDTDGAETTDRWFELSGREVVTRRPSMPAMLTTDPRAVRQDCLCYLMERLRHSRPRTSEHRHELPETAP